MAPEKSLSRGRLVMIWRRLLPQRLDHQIMSLVTLLLSLLMPYFALHEARESGERVVRFVTLQAQALAENIAVTGIAHIVIYDFTSAEQLLLRSARFPGVREIQLTDLDGRVIADVFAGAGAGPQLRYEIQHLSPPGESRSHTEERNGLLTVWEPIMAARQIGWVRLTYSLAEAERITQGYLYDYMMDSAIVALLLVVVILLVMRRPLRMLRTAAAFAGELQTRSGRQLALDGRSIEIEQLAQALNQASTSLFEQETTIKRSAQLEEANRELQHLNRIKSEFVSVVSHELRTPLTSIKSFAEILKEDLEEIDIDTQRHFLSIINDESDRLGRLINDLLDLQKMDSGKMLWRDETVDLVTVLKQAVELFSQAYSDKGLQLRMELPAGECLLDLDADRIRQLIANLLDNALKFTEEGAVAVTVSVAPDVVKVSVTDSGVGVPEGEINRVFESFHQIDRSRGGKAGGSGLGLAICKQIVEHYRGRIWVESSPGAGSCFSFTLPLTGRGREA